MDPNAGEYGHMCTMHCSSVGRSRLLMTRAAVDSSNKQEDAASSRIWFIVKCESSRFIETVLVSYP